MIAYAPEPALVGLTPLRRSLEVTRSCAPLRISFCGGGTDVSPYPETVGGCVLSATIDKYAYVSVRRYQDEQIRVHSDDTGVTATFDALGGTKLTGKLDLAQALFRRFRATALDCYMHSDAPPGSGLGSSSAMIVALITALAREQGLHFSPYEVAELAYAIEREDLRIAGGYQDQYACSFGGFNFIEFGADGAFVTPLRLSEDAVAELRYHLVLVYTGTTRVSSNILEEQTRNVLAGDQNVISSLSRTKELTIAMKRALLRGKLLEVGDLLDQAWQLKRRLASNITNGAIDELYTEAKTAGAVGGKILGAGGGGFLMVVAPFNRRAGVRRRLEQLGGRVVDFQFDNRGARSWQAPAESWAD